MKNMIVALALLIPAAAYGSQVCATESVQALLGSTCSIGQITFNFYSASSTAIGQAPLSLSAVTFTPGGSPDDPSFTLSGAFTSLSPSQSPFYASEYVELDYLATVSQSGSYPEVVSQVEASYSPTDFSSQFTYQDGSGTGFVEYGGTAACFNGIEVTGSQISVNGSSCPTLANDFLGESFDGLSFAYVWSDGSVTSAHLDSGTSTFFVVTQTPEPTTAMLLTAGITALAISRTFRKAIITG